MAAPAAQSHPPKAILTFRVGIVGHRPNRLPADVGPLRDAVQRVLETIKKSVEDCRAGRPGLYADDEPVLRAVSPLAEGSDRR